MILTHIIPMPFYAVLTIQIDVSNGAENGDGVC